MKSLDKDALKKMNEEQHEDFVLINVLPQKFFNENHIRTSINIPHEQENFTDLVALVAGSKQRKIVVYCANFDCDASSKAVKKLEEAGFSRVYDYEGGTEDWFQQRKAS